MTTQDTTGVVYVGGHNEVDIAVLPGVHAEYGTVTQVPKDVAKELLKQKDTWVKPGGSYAGKRRDHARRVTEFEHGGEWPGADKAKANTVYQPLQNNPEDEPEAQFVQPNLEAGDPNPSPEAPDVEVLPNPTKGNK